jgi:hypothetical protein
MTTEKHFKRMVREIALRTGKSYAGTRALLEKQRRSQNVPTQKSVQGEGARRVDRENDSDGSSGSDNGESS